jgi:hypothetical protein
MLTGNVFCAFHALQPARPVSATARFKMLRRLGILLLFLLCGAGCQNPATPTNPSKLPPNLRLANFEKIREGMTLHEVEAILGPPGATTGSDIKRPDGSVIKDVESASWFWSRVGASPDGTQGEQETRRIVVHLKDGKVTSKEQVGLE